MNREQFAQLAAEASVYASTHPRRYRLKVMLLALLGYVVLFGSMVLCMGALYGAVAILSEPWFQAFLRRDFRLIVLTGAVIVTFGTLLFSLVRSFFITWPLPVGVRVQKEDAPELFAAIDELVARGAVRRPERVLLTSEFNASVVQLPRFGWLGSRDILSLGLPLMAALSRTDFTAILAHELAHLRKNHGRFGNWIFRLRTMWGQFLERLQGGVSLGRFFVCFIEWYAPRFNGYTAVLSRAHEFEADAWSAEMAGRQAAAAALLRLAISNKRLDEDFREPLLRWSRTESQPPRDLLQRMLLQLRQPAEAAREAEWLREQIAQTTQPVDSHPALAERLAALGFPLSPGDSLDEVLLPGSISEMGSSLALLPDEFQKSALQDIEIGWQLEQQSSWQSSFEEGKLMRERLRDLERLADAAGGVLSKEQDWENVCLKSNLETKSAAIESLRGFVSRWPEQASAQLALGRLLVEKNDPAATVHLDQAKRLDARNAAEVNALRETQLRRNGHLEQAEAHHAEAIRQADLLDSAALERSSATHKDSYLPGELDEPRLAGLRGELRKLPKIEAAWLVRKKVDLFPEHPCFLLICQIRFRTFEWVTQQKREAVFAEICQNLTLTREGALLFLFRAGERRHALVRKVKAVGEVEIYPLPGPARAPWWKWWARKAPSPAPETTVTAPVLPPPLPPATPPPLPLSAPGTANRGRRRLALSTAVLAAGLAVCLPLLLAARRASPALLRVFTTSKTKEAGKPIVLAPGTSFAEADHQAALRWATRGLLVEGYDRQQHDPRWAAAGRQFIDFTLPWWAGTGESVTAESLRPYLENILGLGCDDPAVLYLAARLSTELDPAAARNGVLLEKATRSFQSSTYYKAAGRLAAEAFVADCVLRREGVGQREFAKKLWRRWFIDEFKDGSFRADEQAVLARQFGPSGAAGNLLEGEAATCLDLLQAADQTSPAPWVRLFLEGKCHIAMAWDARGSGWASEVNASGWSGFKKNLASAREALIQSWQANPRRPEAAAEMIGVAMGENSVFNETERVWFDRATAAQFDYNPAYRRYLWGLRPRWGGSREQMLAFGRNCATTQRFDTEVPLQLLFAMVAVTEEDGGQNQVFSQPAPAGELEATLMGYEHARLPAARAIFYRATHARACEYSAHYQQAWALFKSINFQMPRRVADTLVDGEPAETFLRRICALGGPAAGPIAAAENALLRGDRPVARNLYSAALIAARSEPRAADFIRQRLAILEQEQKLAAGEWIAFLPQAGTNLAGWTNQFGSWTVEADGALLSHTAAQGALLVSDLPIGPNFEISGAMDFSPGATGEVQAGVAFGNVDFDGTDWRSLRVKRGGGEGAIATLAQHWHGGPAKPVKVSDHNTFQLLSWQGNLTLVVNGEVLFKDVLLREGYVSEPTARVALGAYAHPGCVFDVRYRGIKLRRLSAPLAIQLAAAAKSASTR